MTNVDYRLTLDVDWAPDFVIRDVAGLLRDHGVRSTWFVTHASPAIEELRGESELFEYGIHPNFLPGSSHGQSHGEVIKACLEFVPGAICCRTHCLAQSAPILDALIGHGIQIDASLLLFGAQSLQPVQYHSPSGSLHRVPYVWEDCCQLYQPGVDLQQVNLGDRTGLNVVSFHPMHVYLNSRSMTAYRRVAGSGKPLAQLDESDVDPHVDSEFGIRDLFIQLLESMRNLQSHGNLQDVVVGQVVKANS